MMNEPSQGHASLIWRPSVKPTQSPLHYPSTSSQDDDDGQRRRYTKTSLAHHYDDNTASIDYQSLNRRILNASQSYNSTPKPFERQASIRARGSSEQPLSLPPSSSPARLARFASVNREDHLPVQLPPPPPPPPLEKTNIDSMSAKLVHQQYNSPMNLYSMNNIRKTIEAHSELIAPGVKGINFMKADAPVNKQSEVLKLIKEREEEETGRRSRPQDGHQQTNYGLPLTASSNQTINGSSQQQQQRRVQYVAEQHNAATYNHHQSTENYTSHQATKSILKQQQQPVARAVSLDRSIETGSAPKCFECGQTIVGPFARVQDRCVHPHCFNCSTCGTSLKNSGYFTINDKLYCEIHARQVANVMRLNYNFEPNKQAVISNQQQMSEQHARDERTQQFHRAASAEQQQQQQQVDRPSQPSRSLALAEPLAVRPHVELQSPPAPAPAPIVTVASSSPSHCSNCCSMAMRPSARTGHGCATTISTMFSGIGQVNDHSQQCKNACKCQRRSEISWTWRPATSNVEHTNQIADFPSSRTVHLEQQQQQEQHQHQQKIKHESRLQAASYSASSHGTEPNGVGARKAPACCHCRVQIYGPYILAGESTWCKSCSQTNFICQFCHRSLINIGFIEDSQTGQFNCEHCYETLLAPVCAKCNARIRGDCLNALGKRWHPTCFVCGHCWAPFGNCSFYMEDDVPYCERDWNLLFTTKCYCCGYPIEAGDKWIESLGRNYHSDCFRCTGCQVKLEGSTFYSKGGKPYCQMHAR